MRSFDYQVEDFKATALAVEAMTAHDPDCFARMTSLRPDRGGQSCVLSLGVKRTRIEDAVAISYSTMLMLYMTCTLCLLTLNLNS